ncbi:SCF ubiquitin ligase complex subunit cdc4 [Coemansia sp. RSA 376]|nr:SCF ubiquitin ligase complex subunit cdc4 [Coemansia sp. RSA 376]
MVYISSTHYEDAYRRILDGATHTTGTSVLIFASIDVDGICALRLLTTLLKRDSVGHKIIPVNNYADITLMNTTLIESNLQIRSLVFLNCGAQVDIQDLVSLRDGLNVLIVDSHRPFNLYNVYWNEQVQCLDDGDVENNMGELRQAFEDIEFGNNASDDDDDSDSDDEDTGRKRNSDDDVTSKKKRKTGMDPEEFIKVQEQRAKKRELRQYHQTLVQAYYAQGSYYGQSCAVSMLMLAEQLGMPPSADLVWWAIVGATSQYLLHQIDDNGYALVVSRMRDLSRRVSVSSSMPAVSNSRDKAAAGDARRSVNFSSSSSSSQALLDSQLGYPGDSGVFNPYLDIVEEEDDEGFLKARAGVSTAAEAGLLTSSKITARQSTDIMESAELQFTLLRHWSLANAMQYSPFVARRLATWSSRGRSRLDLLVAKLGLSKAEAGAPFVHLAPELKTQLYRRMAEIGADYDMADATYRGFVRNYGWRKSSLSGGDMVQALLALLQPDGATGLESGFYAAYDALAQFSVLKRGLEGAMEMQRLVVGQGVMMLERQAVKTLRSFRLAMVGMENNTVFGSAFALRQLALFLMQTLRERSKVAQSRLPFIIVAPHEDDKLLVLGITPMGQGLVRPQVAGAAFNGSQFAGESRNQFGMVFEAVAQDLGADVRQGFFDSTVLEIKREDMSALPRIDATRLAPEMYPLAHVAAPPALEQFAVEMDGQQLFISQQHAGECQDEDVLAGISGEDVPRAMTPLYTHDDARQLKEQRHHTRHRRSSSPPADGHRRAGRGSPEPRRRSPSDDDSEGRVPLPSPLLSPQACGSGLAAMYSLPELISTYDQLPGPVQAYLLFQLLRRTPRPTLQFAAQVVLPVLHRDFIGALPAEVAHHVLRFMDARTLCRSACVSKRWRAVADGSRAVWRARLADAKYVPEPSRAHPLCLPHFGLGPAPPTQGLTRLSPDELSVACLAPRPATAAAVAEARDLLATVPPEGNPFKALYARGYKLDRNWAEGRCRQQSFACPEGAVATCVEWTGTHVVVGLDTKDIFVFELATGTMVRRLVGHEGGVWALAVVGNTVVSGSTDRTVRVWDLEDGKCTHVFLGHGSTIRCLQILLPTDVRTPVERARGAPVRYEPSEPLVVTGSRDTTLRVWKLPSPKLDKPFPLRRAAPSAEPESMVVDDDDVPAENEPTDDDYRAIREARRTAEPRDNMLPESVTAARVRQRQAAPTIPARTNPYLLHTLAGHSDSVRTVTGFGNMVVSGSYDNSVRVWDATTGTLRHQLDGHTSKVYALELDTDMHLIFSGSMDGTIRVWDWDSGACLRILRGHMTLVGLLALDHSALVSAGADQTLRIWDHPLKGSAACAQEMHPMRPRPFSNIAGDLVPAATAAPAVNPFQHLHNVGPNAVLANHIAAAAAAAAAATANQAQQQPGVTAAAAQAAAANLQQINVLQQLQMQQRGHDQLLHQQLNNPGHMGMDLLRTDRAVLRGHTSAITCFQHDGTKIVSGADNTVKLWDVRTGLFVRDLLSNLTSVWQVRFDSKRCVAAVNRNDVTYFDILDFDI